MSALLAAELLKARTTRAIWGLVVTLVAISGLTVAAVVGADELDDGAPAFSLFDAASISGLFVLLLGILLVTNEYRHGTITATFLVTPARERVVAAKVVAAALVGAVVALAVAAAALAIALPWLSARDEALAVDGELVKAAGRLVLSFALGGALGAAVGTVVHSQVGAIVAVFVWFFILEPLVAALPALLDYFGLIEAGDDSIGRYLPGSAVDALVAAPNDDLLGFGGALVVVLAYIAAFAALGVLLTLRRDVE